MPRPKGSKNKPKTLLNLSPEEIDEQMALIEDEIDALKEQISEKKTELRNLEKGKLAAEKAAAEQKAKEDADAILAAVKASGKSLEDVLNLLQ